MIQSRLLILGIFVGCLVACGKRSNEKLAQTYFKMAFIELSDQTAEPIHAYKRALTFVDQALQQQQKPAFYALKATILLKLGDYQGSDDCFKRAYAGAPDPMLKAEIMNNQACLLAEKGDDCRALAMLQELSRDTAYQTPEVAWVNMGKLYAQKGNVRQARDAFAQAVQIAPSYLDAHFYLAMMAYRLGYAEQAKKSVKTVLDLEPGHQGAVYLANRLGIESQVPVNGQEDTLAFEQNIASYP